MFSQKPYPTVSSSNSHSAWRGDPALRRAKRRLRLTDEGDFQTVTVLVDDRSGLKLSVLESRDPAIDW